MKKLLLIVAALTALVAPSALAQETYTLAASANQVADLTEIVRTHNGRTCDAYNLVLNCTQAAACTAANAVGGSSCTAVQARQASARIFPLTQAGREEYVTFQIAAPAFTSLRATLVPAFGAQQQCKFWNLASTTQTQKDSMCTAANLPTGCSLCP